MTLHVDHLKFCINQQVILEDVSFSLAPGEFCALLGVNGSGKSTLLHCLTGFRPVTGGMVTWGGQAIQLIPRPIFAQTTALVDSEDWDLVPFLVEELFALTREHSDVSRQSPAETAETSEMLERFQLSSLLSKAFIELSRGEQQRVKIAMALLRQPRFLLLDEPTSHLDPFFQREVLSHLQHLAHRKGIGVLAVLHDMNQAAFFDRILVLHQKRLLIDAPPQQVLTSEILGKVFGRDVFSVALIDGKPIGVLQQRLR